MRKVILKVLLFVFISGFSQVGINTTTPKGTLDLVGNPSSTTAVDGVIVPRISRADLINKTVYGTDQEGILIYVSALGGTVTAATENIIEKGYYYFDTSKWQKVSITSAVIGDTKQGFQTADHNNGWILLDGRAISTLTTTQQNNASSLGFTNNLPNATGSYLVQNGNTLGAVSGSNSTTIAQNQLPNVNYTGTLNTIAHGATFAGSASGVFTRSFGGDNGNALGGGSTDRYTLNIPLNGGVTQQSLTISPKSLSVNTFVYLGE